MIDLSLHLNFIIQPTKMYYLIVLRNGFVALNVSA